jgi:S-formylglutathione hydrolase FrmB
MKKMLGDYATNQRVWDEHSVINQVHLLRPGGSPAIIIDCGTSDFFYEVHEALHRKLLYNNIPHDYISRPGGHNGAYWNSAVDYQLLFFRKFFDKADKK